MLLPAVTVQADDQKEERIYYGARSSFREACVGPATRVCKRIILGDRDDDGGLGPIFPPDDDDIHIDVGDWNRGDMILNPSSCDGNTQVTVICDGMYYECPASWVNWEDGSITPR